MASMCSTLKSSKFPYGTLDVRINSNSGIIKMKPKAYIKPVECLQQSVGFGSILDLYGVSIKLKPYPARINPGNINKMVSRDLQWVWEEVGMSIKDALDKGLQGIASANGALLK